MQILENHKRTRIMMARFNRFRTLTDSRSGIFARSTDSPTMQHFQDAQRIYPAFGENSRISDRQGQAGWHSSGISHRAVQRADG